jgi:hypothetical protein
MVRTRSPGGACAVRCAVSNHETAIHTFSFVFFILRDAAKRAMTYDDARKIALAWPEVEDGTSYGTPALKVRKKMLVRLKEDGDSLVMRAYRSTSGTCWWRASHACFTSPITTGIIRWS